MPEGILPAFPYEEPQTPCRLGGVKDIKNRCSALAQCADKRGILCRAIAKDSKIERLRVRIAISISGGINYSYSGEIGKGKILLIEYEGDLITKLAQQFGQRDHVRRMCIGKAQGNDRGSS